VEEQEVRTDTSEDYKTFWVIEWQQQLPVNTNMVVVFPAPLCPTRAVMLPS